MRLNFGRPGVYMQRQYRRYSGIYGLFGSVRSYRVCVRNEGPHTSRFRVAATATPCLCAWPVLRLCAVALG